MPLFVYLDILCTGVMMLLFFVALDFRTNGYIRPYFVVPSLLIWCHVVGNALQEMEKGPAWVQQHFHDVGVATCGLWVLSLVNLFMGWGWGTRPGLTKVLMSCTMISHFSATVACILLEVYQVTINRESAMARGYSGNLDIGDVVAFFMGLAIMFGNHIVMKRRILGKMQKAGDLSAF